MSYILHSNVLTFNNQEEIISKLKELGISYKNRKGEIKPLYYKGFLTDGKPVECTLIGIIRNNNYETLVIEFNNELHNISPDYFKEMQNNSFIYKLGGIDE